MRADFSVFRDLDPWPDVMDPELVAHPTSLKAADGLGKLNVKAKAAEVSAISLPLSGPIVVHFQSPST